MGRDRSDRRGNGNWRSSRERRAGSDDVTLSTSTMPPKNGQLSNHVTSLSSLMPNGDSYPRKSEDLAAWGLHQRYWGLVLGGFITIATALVVEGLRRPKLNIEI